MRLHGHHLDRNMARAATAEAVGTFVLVLAITSAAVAATLARPLAGAPYGSLAVPVAGGLALAVLAASIGPISGAHLNPAVTLGLAANGRFPWAYVPAYTTAQFAGAIGAAAVTWGLYGNQAKTLAGLGATYPAAGVSAARVCAAEGIVTFVLVLVIIAVTTDNRVPRGTAALAIGAALAAAILISGPVSGAGVNPARAIGPMIVVGRFTDWWAYLAAPVIAGTLAVTLYDRFLRAGSTPSLGPNTMDRLADVAADLEADTQPAQLRSSAPDRSMTQRRMPSPHATLAVPDLAPIPPPRRSPPGTGDHPRRCRITATERSELCRPDHSTYHPDLDDARRDQRQANIRSGGSRAPLLGRPSPYVT